MSQWLKARKKLCAESSGAAFGGTTDSVDGIEHAHTAMFCYIAHQPSWYFRYPTLFVRLFHRLSASEPQVTEDRGLLYYSQIINGLENLLEESNYPFKETCG